MTQRPFIGITVDSKDQAEHAAFNYLLKKNYCAYIRAKGGIPLLIPHELDCIEAYLSRIEGLLVTGGGHDIDPQVYGDATMHPTVTLNPSRSAFELAITKAALERNMPVLGICGGHQVINVALGGTLIQHIPESHPSDLAHQQSTPPHEASHDIEIVSGTLLHAITDQTTIAVNSFHHQAVREPGEGVVINARSSDGLIEGIEAPAYRFCLGLQWHPERTLLPHDKNIVQAFIEAADG